jgi:capsular exopolysaccharide synthesis family protein
MTLQAILSTLWRRRLLFLLSVALGLGAVAALTFSLPKTYRATATLFVGTAPEVDEALIDTTVGEQLARTYTTLAGNPNVADAVRSELPYSTSRPELLAKMSFAPVERTRLIEISAEDDSRQRAQDLANEYARVFADRANAAASSDGTQATVTISEPAALPAGAVKPNPPLYLGLGAVFAMLVATGIALLRERFDDRLLVSSEDAVLLGHPIVGRIPTASRHGVALLADAFRLLKTNVDFLYGGPTQVVLVTSAAAVQGKSTVASRLALADLGEGETVALVEADLRRPGIAESDLGLGVEASPVGLTDYLIGARSLAEVKEPVPGRPGLDVLWSGPIPPNPSGLLGSPKFAQLIRELRETYDRVIIDTPPISIGADASIAVPLADVSLFVVDAQNNRRSSVRSGLRQLEAARPSRIGVVLSRIELPRSEQSQYYVDGIQARHGPTLARSNRLSKR